MKNVDIQEEEEEEVIEGDSIDKRTMKGPK
jgi:hypothetical protein